MTRRALLSAVLATPLLAGGALLPPPRSDLEPILAAKDWLGQPPPKARLLGRVVLLDIFTFECVNCVRVTPNLKTLYSEYSRSVLEIVAVHTPEVPSYQSRIAYLAQQTRAAELPWPIAIDNDYRIWNAYGVSAWPTQFVFDKNGRLRNTIVGDSQDDAIDSAIRKLVVQP